MGVPDIVKMAARSVGLSSAICRNAASRTRGRSPGARWTSSNRYATKRSGTATAWPFASPGETGLPGVALAMSGGLPPVFSIEKREISCGLPLSKSWNLALVSRTILGVFAIFFAIFAITELPPTPRRVVKPDQTFPDKLEHWQRYARQRSLDNPLQARPLLRAARDRRGTGSR